MSLAQPIVLTAGEPAGIGPDLMVQIAQQPFSSGKVVVADPDLLLSRAKILRLPLRVIPYDKGKLSHSWQTGDLTVIPLKLNVPCRAGELDPENAEYVMQTLTTAATACLQGEFSALVTGPVHKGVLNQAGIKFSGHTEFLADLAKTPLTVMLFLGKKLKVALVTTHLPLRAVPDAITPSRLTQTIQIVHDGLQHYFDIKKPKILVCGLNPHAGEGGYLGREEIEVIIPVLQQLREQGLELLGPVSADTAFTEQQVTQADVVLAMYHDQGLVALKQNDFENAVNVTLGLPFIRTSVDHGTALELAGTGRAKVQNLINAIHLATTLTKKGSSLNLIHAA